MEPMPQVKQRHSRKAWQEIIRSYKESGKTRESFCEEMGLRYATFRQWLGVFEEGKSYRDQRSRNKSNNFQELKLDYASDKVKVASSLKSGSFSGESERQKEGTNQHKFQKFMFDIPQSHEDNKCLIEGTYELVLGGARLYIPGNFNEQTLSRLLTVMRSD